MSKKSILDIKDILNDYSSDIQEAIIAEAEKVSKKGRDELKNTSPKRTGKYRKGWKVKTEKGNGFVECIIHNSTNYQLTHLLEHSHLTRNGRKTTPKVHIKPVEQACIKEYEKSVEKIIKNGG
jgi:hypothetical protein